MPPNLPTNPANPTNSAKASRPQTPAACVRHIDNALLPDGRLVRLSIGNALIDKITPMAEVAHPGDAALDLQGRLVMPLLIDGHMHLDKTLLGMPWTPHKAGPTIVSRIEEERKAMPGLTLSTADRATHLIRAAAAHGTGALRTHVDIAPQGELHALEGVLQARQDNRAWASIQVVAFPQSGVMRCPGVLDLLDSAVAAGADLVGGIDPCEIDSDPAGQLNGIFSIANRRGVGVDIHLHEAGDLGLFSIREICKRTRALGMNGRVTVSHGFCLGQVPEAKARASAELMAQAGVSLMTHGAAGQPLPPLALLREHGVTTFVGSDNVRDFWSPYGTADILERAALVGWRADWRRDEQMLDALDLVTGSAARATGLSFTLLEEGAPASFFSIPARCVQEALATHVPRALVVREGQILARNGLACERPEAL